MKNRRVAQFDSITPEYSRAFQTFLAHTDQKEKAIAWLDREIASLAQHRTAIDAGTGTGKLTAWLIDRFERVVAIKPNPSLGNDFRAACPTVDILPETILSAEPNLGADFVLCSHVFYYIPRAEWEENVERLISWLCRCQRSMPATGHRREAFLALRLLRNVSNVYSSAISFVPNHAIEIECQRADP